MEGTVPDFTGWLSDKFKTHGKLKDEANLSHVRTCWRVRNRLKCGRLDDLGGD